MSPTPAANAEMLVLARLSRGMKQGDVAQAMGVTQGLVSKVENQIAAPTQDYLAAFSDVVGYPTTLFWRPEHVRGSDSICFHHRKQKSMPVKVLEQVEAEMHLAQLQVKRLIDEIQIESANEFLTLDPDEYGGPQHVAQLLRGAWKIPAGPIPNLVQVVESAGGVILFREFGTLKLDGMSCWARGCPPLFFLNAAMPMDRLRWTVAHELGHLIMHATPPSADPEEQANRFALEFLAPEAELKPDLRDVTFRRLPMLKAYWRMSMAALANAAKTIGALPDNKVRSLFVQISRAGYRTGEPFALPREEPTLVAEAIRVHLREHHYSTAQLASLVDLAPDEFSELYLSGQNIIRSVPGLVAPSDRSRPTGDLRPLSG